MFSPLANRPKRGLCALSVAFAKKANLPANRNKGVYTDVLNLGISKAVSHRVKLLVHLGQTCLLCLAAASYGLIHITCHPRTFNGGRLGWNLLGHHLLFYVLSNKKYL